MIDAGADLIAASHPHSVQETKVYNDKLIVYSMGNFIFDQQGWDVVESSVALDLTMTFENSTQLSQLENWLSLTGCDKPKDDCTEESNIFEGDKNSSLPDLEYDLIPGKQTNLVQSKLPVTGPLYNTILQIANWTETKKKLDEIN